jgi:acyl carrier protein
MTALDQLKDCFIETFALTAAEDPAALRYQGIAAWDSVGHMQLVAAIETRFDLMLDTSEILDMSDFGQAVEIVRRHGVDV